jgi:ubiquinone/menaquinone biosynthesis C-methylase UbiE
MDWNKIARKYSNIQDMRKQIVFPWVHNYIEEIQCKSLLDIGCGDGEFALTCTDIEDLDIVLYDPSPNMRDITRKNIEFMPNLHIVDKLPYQTFDVITFLTVWMCIQTQEDCLRVLKEINACLRQDGILIASVTHPCFRDCHFSTYHTDFDPRNYLKEGIEFNVTIEDGLNNLQIVDTHWNLTSMSKQLKQSGFVIEQIEELPDLSQGKSQGKGVPWLILIASKQR